MNVVTRFAPSPTGFMHIGGLRTALFAYLWARKNGGSFILRIEDTDKEREVPGSIAHIQESLAWLGLEYDYGPDKPGNFGSCIQSERLQTYRDAAQILIDRGLAYADPYAAEELEAFRAQAQAEKRPFLYRDHRPENPPAWDGTKPLRLKIPEIKRYHWNDAVRGDLSAGEEALDDFILIKADGYPTYNFAHIVDDMNMGVTHIMRGDEFISSTPRFLSLYDALRIQPPVFVTLPPILRDDKTKKLGKRDGAKDILEYRTEGFLPEAMLNFLAFIGWNPGTEQELFTKDALIQAFDLSAVQRHGGVSNEEKLRWFNREYLAKYSDAAFSAYIMPTLAESLKARTIEIGDDIATKIVPIIRERIENLDDLKQMAAAGEFDFYCTDPAPQPALIPGKNGNPADATVHLAAVRELLTNASSEEFANADSIKNVIWDYATEKGRAAVLWPLRYALTGREKSPDPFTVISIIGKERSLQRIDAALSVLHGL